MGRYTDEQLAQLMCQIYTDYYDEKTEIIDNLIEKTINKKIRELSDKTHKTEKHLKFLLDDFFGSFTPEQQKKITITKNEIIKHKKTDILDRVEGLSYEQLREYLKIEHACKIIAKLNNIIEGKNRERAAKAKQILKLVIELEKEKKDKEMKENKNSKYMEIKEIFDTMVNNGFFSLAHFSIEFHNKYGLSNKIFADKIKYYMDFLKNKYPEEYNKYQFRMEQNLWISYEKNRRQIERMIELQEQYDIIDYYMHINLPPKAFLYMCEYMLTDEEYLKVKRFIRKHFEFPSYNPKNTSWIVAPVAMVKGEIVTQETQEMILKFMEENNIPSNFFIACLTKYRNNELNIDKQNVKSLK